MNDVELVDDVAVDGLEVALGGRRITTDVKADEQGALIGRGLLHFEPVLTPVVGGVDRAPPGVVLMQIRRPGADALAAVYALVWFPYWSMLAFLMAGMLISAIVIIAIKYRRNMAKHIVETISKNQAGTRAPTLTGFLLGTSIFTVAASLPLLNIQ